MPIFKLVFQYTQPDNGFSEVFYTEAANLQFASDLPPALVPGMLQPRTALTALRKVRVSDTANNRNSVVININRSAATSQNDPDICSTSAIVTLNSTITGARRQVWLRGLPDGFVARVRSTGVDDPSPLCQQAMIDYIRVVSNAGFGIRSLKKLGTAPLVYTPISGVEIVGPGVTILHFTDDIVITASRRIIISQLDQKRFGGLVGEFAVIEATSRTVKVAYNSALAPATYAVAKGRSRPAEYEFGPIDQTTSRFNKFGSRDTGKNPLGGRGRRSRHLTRLG